MKRNIFLILIFCVSLLNSQTKNDPQKVRMAKSYEKVQEYEKALEIYMELYKNKPNDYSFFDGIKRNLLALARYDELTLFLEEGYENFPNNHNVLAALSRTYYQIGKFEKAKSTWEKILSIDPKRLFYYTFVADIQFKLRLVDDAILTLLRAREKVGNNTTVTNNLATFYRWRRDYEKAADEYIKLYFLRDKLFGTIQGTILSFPDDSVTYKKVTNVINNGIDRRKDENLYRLLYNYQVKSKNFADAFETSRIIDRKFNRKGDEILRFSRTAFRENALPEAERGLKTLINEFSGFKKSGEVKFIFVYTTEKMIEQGYFDGSDSLKIVKYHEVIDNYRNIANEFKGQNWEKEAYFRIGEIQFNLFFNLDEAIIAFSAAAQGKSKSPISYNSSIRIGDCLLAKGHLTAAQKIFDENANLKHKTLIKIKNTAVFKSAKVDFYKGDFQTTLDKLNNIINSNTLDKDLINDCLELKMLISENIENYRNALVMYAGAERLTLQKNYGEALIYLGNIIDNFKETELIGYSLFQMAVISAKLNKYEDSAKYYNLLINNCPGSRYFEEAYEGLGIIYAENLNRIDDAVKIYEDFIINHPNSMNVDNIRKRIREMEKKNKG